MKILIVGCGSIGKRHMGTLQQIGGHELIAYRTHREDSQKLEAHYGVRIFYSMEEALAQKPEAAIIANPTSLHVAAARQALAAGCHLFMEKPISHTLEGVEELLQQAEKQKRVVFIGYQWRFNPLLIRAKEQIDAGAMGKILFVRTQIGQYLPDWHPWEDYRKGYYGREDLGGGALLTLSHNLDYLLWFLGKPAQVSCFMDKVSELEIDTEDMAELILRFPSGALGSVHMDYLQRTTTHTCQIIGEEGEMVIDLQQGTARTFLADMGQWHEDRLPKGFARDDMFLAELKHFLDCINNGVPCRMDGRRVGRLALEVICAAQESAGTGKVVSLDERITV